AHCGSSVRCVRSLSARQQRRVPIFRRRKIGRRSGSFSSTHANNCLLSGPCVGKRTVNCAICPYPSARSVLKKFATHASNGGSTDSNWLNQMHCRGSRTRGLCVQTG